MIYNSIAQNVKLATNEHEFSRKALNKFVYFVFICGLTLNNSCIDEMIARLVIFCQHVQTFKLDQTDLGEKINVTIPAKEKHRLRAVTVDVFV